MESLTRRNKRMTGNKKRAAGGEKKPKSASIVEKLNTLRSLGCPGLSESDLARCLSQAGWNVDVAAERLVTGQFRPLKKSNQRTKFNPNTNTNNKTTRTEASFASSGSNETPRRASTTKLTLSTNLVTPKNTSSVSTRNCDETNDHLENDEDEDEDIGWLICQRWISDGVNLKRGASCDYQEELNVLVEIVSTPPNGSNISNNNNNRYQQNKTGKNNDKSLRFRSFNIEGSFPRYLSLILGPLLRNRFVRVKATALMEERNLNIGSQVAFSLSVWIIEPIEFFAIFDNSNDEKTTASYSKQFFATAASNVNADTKRPGRHNKNDLRKAAFSLLQWAQHGKSTSPLEKVQKDNNMDKGVQGDDDSDDSEEDVDGGKSVVHTSANNEEADIPEWAIGVLRTEDNDNDSSNDNDDDKNTMDTPSGFRGVELRPYQKQALYWMTQREQKIAPGRNEILQLLNELAGATKPIRGGGEGDDDEVFVLETKMIKCDCGPVQVDTNRVQVPSVTAPPGYSPTSSTHHQHHPLWEQRFLCNDQQTKALSFFVQPCFGNASSQPPPPPAPCRGGILADSMGLGKTVQLLAMMQVDKDKDENYNMQNTETTDKAQTNDPTLVVAPLSLLYQWEQEIENKTQLTHRVHYKDGKKKLCVSYDDIDCVLTTYGQLQAEFRAQQKQKETTGELLSRNWKRVILDECHTIKNHQTLVAKACCSVRAERRWCVSGTIIQNSLEDVYSLMRFLRHEPFCEKAFWNSSITNVSDFPVALDRVKKILSPIMIRRTKETLDKNGKLILTLPAIDFKSVAVEFSPEERQFYEALYQKSFDIFKGFIRAGTASSSWLKIFSLLQRLRQTCSHVALTVKSQLDDGEWMSNINKDPTKNSTNQNQEKIADFIDSSFLEDLLHQKFKSMQKRTNTKSTDCGNDDSNCEYTSSVAQMFSNAIQNKSSELNDECSICLMNIKLIDSVVTPCLHIFCKGCLLNYMKNERQKKVSDTTKVKPMSGFNCIDTGSCPICSEEIDSRKILRIGYSNSGNIQTSFLHESLHENSLTASSHNEEDADARKTLQTAIQGLGSSKLAAIHKELQIVWEKEPKSKVLIFSQYLGFLDIIQKSFKTNDIPCARLDGSLNLKERMKVLRDFGCESSSSSSSGSTSSLNSNIGSVLLISMKAGGVGLNLVAARSVFIVDPWWNVAVEDQCVDRIHRIGQTADKIYVRKFFVTNSIEERILELQKRKKNIARAALCDKEVVRVDGIGARQSLEDFKILFGEPTSL
mmetsp:Transcript_30966/g.35596  ORF Transcript_30966/g.35596 Transcript_30966/m.35596 type:complete len:1263 (-) Transcript_30966:110-3898(-)